MNTLRLFHCFIEHLTIKIISNRIHMSMLLRTQQISGTSKFQISHCNLKSASQIRILADRSQTLLSRLLQHHILSVHQKRIGSSVGTPDPSPKLIKLRKPVSVWIMDNHSIYIGNIQPCLNDRGGNQHINIPVYKGIHHILQFPLTHLAMSKIHPCVRHQLRNTQGNICNIRHSIINIINLSASAQFPVDSLSDCLFIIFHNICLDRHSVHRRFL